MLILIIYLLFQHSLNFAIFLLIVQLPIEIFLFPRELIITDTKISFHVIHLAGIVRKNITISIDNIQAINVLNNFSGVETAEEEDNSFSVYPGIGNPPFALYQITYFDNSKKIRSLKINLDPNEFIIIQKIIKSIN